MSDTQTKTQVSPIVAIAAVSIVIFSAVGVGVMTGVIPSSFSRTAEQPQQATSAASARADKRQPQKTASTQRKAASEPTRVASAESAKPGARVCASCGTVVSVNVVKQEGEGTGLGAVAGGVVGGVLGNQVGSGSGRKVATVAGAAGGAYAGHQIEKHVKSTQYYNVAVRMDDGSTRAVSYDKEPAFRAGDKVRIVDGALVLN